MLTLTDWRELSACRDSDPDLFFPIGSTGAAVDQIEKATAICGACSVREACLQYAFETNQEAGVWGGSLRGAASHLCGKPARCDPLSEPDHLLFFGVDLDESHLVDGEAVAGALGVRDPGHRVAAGHCGVDRLDHGFGVVDFDF